jgi:hypothetical protein
MRKSRKSPVMRVVHTSEPERLRTHTLGRRQVHTELFVTTRDKLMTIDSHAACAATPGILETTCERFDRAAKQVLRARWQCDVDGALVCRWVSERAIPTRGESGADERLTPIPADKSHLTALDAHAEADRVAEQHSYAAHLPRRA